MYEMVEEQSSDSPFRFFDNREKYLQFVNTCNEKQVIAERVAIDAGHIEPVQPALRIFDAGMGDATVLTRVMRHFHHRFPTVPFLVVGKEISMEDVRISLEKMADRFQEHPLTVLVVTNMLYSEAPNLSPRRASTRAKLNWREVALEGSTAHEFDEQIQDLEPLLHSWWATTTGKKSQNPVYVTPSAIVMYRRDHAWPLASIIPQKGMTNLEYDLVIAAQPYRSRLTADAKVKTVLAPLARALAPSGLMVVMQSTGKDPGMEIVRAIWPDEDPFKTSRQAMLRELRAQLGDDRPDLRFLSYPDSRAEFRYRLRLTPNEAQNAIGTSTILAAWNAATYVAQIDDGALGEAMRRGDYLDVTRDVVARHNGLWFTDESFMVART